MTRFRSIIHREARYFFPILAIVVGCWAPWKIFTIVRESGGHWVLSVRDEAGGMIVRVGNTNSDEPIYTVIVKGYGLGRDAGPIVLDRDDPPLPEGMRRTFLDSTMLPGRCILQSGPLTLDVMEACASANGIPCDPGETIAITLPAPPPANATTPSRP